ncbi:uncharacterized protein LOC103521594, partial [Diaphorina citri]|uniref:Uncharacterized protein LOC103521594 n=1 Tax=Diaphorina citri TaxID=121845 RepID=A0A1S3DNC6_DIACI
MVPQDSDRPFTHIAQGSPNIRLLNVVKLKCARSYSRRSKSNRNLDQQKRLESSVAKYRSVSHRYDRNCKRALDDKTSRVAHIRDCYNKYNKKIIEGDGVDCCKKDVDRSPDRQRGGFRMKYRNYSSRPNNEHGSYSPPPCSKPFTKRPRKSRCNDSFEHAHNRGNAISKERRSNYADRSKSPDCFVICSNKRGSDRDQYNADANRIPNCGKREKRMDRSAERLNERVKCLCLENDNRSRNEKFVKSDEGDDKGIKKCMEQCIEKFTGLYNKKENGRSKCGDRREKSIDQTNDCNRENYRKKVSGGDSCKDLCRKKPEERTKFIDDRIRHFEESVRKLCSDQSTHKNKDQCKQRDHEEEQGEESLPREKIEIIVTACESFSPEGENENQRQSPEDTCVCSCQSDDEDKFYTPDGCYSSEMRENNPPAEKTEGMVDYVNSYFSKDSGSRHSCNACESNKQQKRYFNKSTRIQETKEQLQKTKFDYTLNRFG